MRASPLSFLRAGPPPPKVVLLPDALFFTRVVPVAAGATAADASAQVELALEAISPFPLAQLYYGWFWTAGAEWAFVYASYRRRFTADQIAAWDGAELVLPSFAAVFGAAMPPATTVVVASPEGLTAVHWDSAAVPAKVLFRSVDPAGPEEARGQVRDELLGAMGGSKTILDLPVSPVPDRAHNDREIVFRSGDFVSRLAASAAMDVRDKDELVALRSARKRDVLLWRVTLGCAAALLLLGVGEFALMGGKAWQKVRSKQLNAQKPLVEKIMSSQALATRIDELATKRLLPFEMLTILVGEGDGSRKPADILLNRAQTLTSDGIYTLLVDATTNNIGQVSVWENTLRQLPACEKVEVRDLRPRGEGATFQLVVTFKPDALKPMQLPGGQVAGVVTP